MGRLALPAVQRPQRFLAKQGNLAYSSGATALQQVSQTDYLTSLDVISLQTVVTGTAAPTTPSTGSSSLVAFTPLANVQVKVNGGRAPFSLPGYHVDIYNRIWNDGYGGVATLTTAPLVTSATNNWTGHLRVPLTIDPIAEKGSWYTGDTQLNLTAALTFNPVANVFGTVNGATIGGSYDLYSEKFSAPAPDEPFGWLDEISYYHQVELYATQQLSNGTTNITLETDQDFVRIFMIAYTGSAVGSGATFAPADALYTNLSLIVNDKFRIIDTCAEAKIRLEMLESYTDVLPAGTIVLDFMRLNPPTRRDFLPTDPDAVKRLQLQIVSTSSNNFVDVCTDTVVDSQFAEKWALSAKAKSGKR